MESIQSWDSRRDFIVVGDAEQTIQFAAKHWIHSAKRAIQERGRFAVALSGGSTPKAIYQEIARSHKNSVDWKKVFVFWSDERAVLPTESESNYHMAMQSGFGELPLAANQIFRMKAEKEIEKNALEYEEIIRRELGMHLFDLVMLGVGEDGHTASLFPKTDALHEQKRLVVPNQHFEGANKKERMTLTFPCIQASRRAVIYAMGENKQAIVPLVLNAAILSPFPASTIGSEEHKALWIMDTSAARML